MVIIQDILIKARLDGIKEIITPQYMRYYFQVRCIRCGEVNNKDIYAVLEEWYGPYNFIMKCKLCENEGTINIIYKSRDWYHEERNETFQTICQCETNGLVIVAFRMNNGWKVVSSLGKVWEDVDLSQGDWCEYDEGQDKVVGIYEIETKVI